MTPEKILVIGATSAIAYETTRYFARNHAHLYLVARNAEKLETIKNDLQVRGARVETCQLDLNNLDQHQHMIQSAIDTLGGLDIVLISHGTLGEQQLCQQSVAKTLEELTINLTSVISLLTILANYFEQQRHGCIAVVTFVAGDRGRPSNYIYGTSKGAVSIFLQGLRSRLAKSGVTVLTIEGGHPLHGTTHHIGPDHIEVGSFIGLAAVTNSEIRIEKAGIEHLRSIRLGFERLGIVCNEDGEDLIVPADQSRKIQSDLGGHVPKLEDQPWPAFPADVMSIAIVTATQCEGVIVMFEKMFESRMFFVDKLIGMGARIILCDPHRAVVVGPAKLHASQLESPDIRAGMAILLAALCAQGQSIIDNVRQIERGYERIDERLRALGAHIERVDDRRQG